MCKLDKMRLVNCQSWEDTTIEFGPGINVLIGTNSTGKSVFFKVLDLVGIAGLAKRLDRESIIRKGAEYAEVYYLFSDNSMAVIRIFPQRILYYFTEDASSGNFTQYENQLPEDIRKRLSLLVDPTSGFIANKLDDPGELLFVNSNPKTSTSFINILARDARLEKLIEIFETKVGTYSKYENELTVITNSLEHRLNAAQYVNVEELTDRIEVGEDLLDCADTLNRLFNQYITLSKCVTKQEPLDDWDILSNMLLDICTPLNDYHFIETIPNDLEPVVDLSLHLAEFINGYRTTLDEEFLNGCSSMLDLCDCVKDLKVEEEVDYEGVLQELNAITTLHKLTQSYITLFNTLSDLNKVTKEIEELENIDFEGEVFDCPIHGKIQWVDKTCKPV